MLSRFDRAVHLVHLEAGAYPPSAPDVPLSHALEIIDENWKLTNAVGYITDTGRIVRPNVGGGEGMASEPIDTRDAIYTSDFELDKAAGVATILITRGDPNVADPAYVQPSSKAVRYVRPKEGESQGCSAHMLIELNGSSNQKNARVVIERVPLASKTFVWTYINWLLRTVAESDPAFTYEIPRGSEKPPEQKSYRPIFRLRDRPSATLRQDLERGQVSSVELVRNEEFIVGTDQSRIVKSTEHVVRLGIRKGTSKEKVKSFLDSVFKKKVRSDYDEVIIKLTNLPGDKSKSVRFQEDLEDALDLMYARTTNTQFPNEVDQCHSKINKTIKENLISILKDQNNWK